MALTRLNWNSASYYSYWPATLMFSVRVDEILRRIQLGAKIQQNYYYYMQGRITPLAVGAAPNFGSSQETRQNPSASRLFYQDVPNANSLPDKTISDSKERYYNLWGVVVGAVISIVLFGLLLVALFFQDIPDRDVVIALSGTVSGGFLALTFDEAVLRARSERMAVERQAALIARNERLEQELKNIQNQTNQIVGARLNEEKFRCAQAYELGRIVSARHSGDWASSPVSELVLKDLAQGLDVSADPPMGERDWGDDWLWGTIDAKYSGDVSWGYFLGTRMSRMMHSVKEHEETIANTFGSSFDTLEKDQGVVEYVAKALEDLDDPTVAVENKVSLLLAIDFYLMRLNDPEASRIMKEFYATGLMPHDGAKFKDRIQVVFNTTSYLIMEANANELWKSYPLDWHRSEDDHD